MQKEEINFASSVLYSQEQNGVTKQMGKAIINITRAIIFKKNIDNKL